MRDGMIEKGEILNMLESINHQLNELERVLSTSVSEYKGEMYDDQIEKINHLDQMLSITERKAAEIDMGIDQAAVLRRRTQTEKGFKLELGF